MNGAMNDNHNIEKIKDVLRGKVETFIERVTPVYQALNWKWNINGEVRPPNEEDVMFKLYEIIDALQYNEKGYWCAANGMKAQYRFVNNGVDISITFTKEIKDQGVYNF